MIQPVHQNSSEQNEEFTDLSQYWSTIWRYKWNIFGFVLVIVLATSIVVFSMEKVYRASTTLLIESESAKVVSIEDVYKSNTSNKEYFLTQFEVLKSRELAERVVKRLDLQNHILFDPRQQKPGFSLRSLIPSEDKEPLSDAVLLDLVVMKLQAGLSITPIRNTQLVKINFESTSPELSALIADTVADEYIQRHIEAQLSVTVQAADWLMARLGGLRETLQESEKRLQEYRDAEGLIDVQGVQTIDADEIEELTRRYADATIARSEAESLHSYVQQLGEMPSIEQLMAIPAVALNPLVKSLKEEQVRASRKVAELSKRYGPKHPKMIAAKSDAGEAYNSLAYQVRRVGRGIETQYRGAVNTEQSLKARISEAKERFQGVNRKEFKLRELEREVEANRQLYDMFLTRAKETGEAEGLQAPHARVVDPAVTPRFPIKPNKKLTLALSAVLSGLVGVVLAFLLEALNNTIRRPDQVEEKLGVPMLGFLPFEPSNKSKLPYEGFSLGAKGVFSESIRTVRTSLVLSGIDSPHKVFLVTSSVPGEGKSTVALNLARALGQVEKVLLIDADMRRPTLSRVLDLPRGSPGLSNWVAGTAKIADIFFQMDDWPVDVMPSGQIPQNPLELLSSKRFASAIEKLKQHYDRIVIDSAPICAVSDAMIISQHADSIVYVIKSDSTPCPVVKKGVNSFRDINIPLHSVLNQVDVKRSGHYYSEYFRNYGYSSEEEFYAQKKYQKKRENEIEYVQKRVAGIDEIP